MSLHHTFVIHCFTHLCAVSLYNSRSSVVHACGRSGQFSKCSIVCGSSVQSHVVSSSQYPHLFILYLHLPTLVLSLLRHCHSHHGNEDPVANDSDGVMFSCVGVDCRWLVHADNLFSEGLHVMGWTDCTKLFLDLRRFVGAIENEAITFNGISFSSSKQLATKFNQHFKAGQTYFFKRDQSSDEGNHWRWCDHSPRT